MSKVPAVWERIENELEIKEEFSDSDISELKELFLRHFDEMNFGVDDVRLSSFSTRYFKAIGRTESVNFDSRSTYLYGPNSKGKTSLVRAIQFNIAGIPIGEEDTFGMRNLVHDDSDRLSTIGFWRFDESPYTLERYLVQTGSGGKRTEYDHPYLREGFIEESQSFTERLENPKERIKEDSIKNTELWRKFGLQELKERGHSPFEVLSLFFLMGEDFKRFFGSNSKLIDLLFGISVSQVVEAIEERIDELELQDEEANAQGNLERFKIEKEETEEEIANLKSQRKQKISQLSQLQGRLESIQDTLSGGDKAKKLENRRNELRGRRADLKVRMEETVEELGQIKRLIERHDNTELHQDLSGIADDLRSLMTVPDMCPICTNDVDSEQRSRLVDNGDCPLCAKEMPDERIRVELEHQSTDSLTDDTIDRDKIQEYRKKKRELEGERDNLQKQIDSIENELTTISQRLEESEVKELTVEKTTIRENIDQTRQEIFDIESKIESQKQELERLEYEIRAQEYLISASKKKKRRRKMYKRFEPIIEEQRKKRRQKLKRELEEEIQTLLEVFSKGTFSEAHNPRFEEGNSYHFTIQTPDGELKSRRPEPSTAETNIHAFLFHTALLRRLSSSINSLPLRMFVIDSPFTNEIDGDNEEDITTFLKKLPELLPNYQLIVTSAATEGFDSSTFEDTYNMKKYPSDSQADLGQFSD